MNKNGKLFIISASSGAGKTSIATTVIEKLKNTIPISKVITYTTRNPRPEEINGIDYNFISTQDFLKKETAGFFLETTKYTNQYYGSPSSIIQDLKKGKSFIIVTDMAGAINFKHNIMPNAITIWITVSDTQELRKRLEKRGDPSDIIEKRLKLTSEETRKESREKYFDYHVENDIFDQAVAQVIEIIKNNLGI